MLGSLPSLGSGKVFGPFQIKFHGVRADRSGGRAYIRWGRERFLDHFKSNPIGCGRAGRAGGHIFKFCCGMCDLWQDTAILSSFGPMWWLLFQHHLDYRLDMPPPARLHISFHAWPWPWEQILESQIRNSSIRTAKGGGCSSWAEPSAAEVAAAAPEVAALRWRRCWSWTHWRVWVKQATQEASPASEAGAYCLRCVMHPIATGGPRIQSPAIQKVWSHASMEIKKHMLEEHEHDSLYTCSKHLKHVPSIDIWAPWYLNTVQNTNIWTPLLHLPCNSSTNPSWIPERIVNPRKQRESQNPLEPKNLCRESKNPLWILEHMHRESSKFVVNP